MDPRRLAHLVSQLIVSQLVYRFQDADDDLDDDEAFEEEEDEENEEREDDGEEGEGADNDEDEDDEEDEEEETWQVLARLTSPSEVPTLAPFPPERILGAGTALYKGI